MGKKGILLRLILIVGLLGLGLAFTGGKAQAGVTWCDADLGPMAVRAEDTDNIPQHVLDKKVVVPAQAVSESKEEGGTNTHK